MKIRMKNSIKWYQKEVTWGILVKLMICINLVALAMCWKISNIRITQDEETFEYINYLENYIDYLEKDD